MNREKKATVAEKDPFGHIDEELERRKELNSSQGNNGGGGGSYDLEYPGFEVEDQVTELFS
jgi:hypothetical protein